MLLGVPVIFFEKILFRGTFVLPLALCPFVGDLCSPVY